MGYSDRQTFLFKPRKGKFEAWETNGKGFGIEISPTGRKSFIFLYQFKGEPRILTLGVYPQMSLADAQWAHTCACQILGVGMDPSKVEQKTLEEVNGSLSVENMVREFIEKYAKVRKKSWKEDQRILYKEVIPRWGNREAQDITRREIILLLDEIVERGALIQANRTLAAIRKMFSFALGRGILEANPCFGIPAPSRENRRDRVLNEEEIRIFWERLDTAKMNRGTALSLKFQLITCQRKGEVVGAEWRDFDLNNGWWTIPSEKSKNNFLHRIPLTSLAIDILKEIRIISGESGWLFPSRIEDKHIAKTSVDHAVLKNLDHFGIDSFTPHDLRRTAASHMTSLGVPRLIVKKILNHSDRDVTSIYDRYSYGKEKQKAMKTWEIKLRAIISKKVRGIIPLYK